MVKKIIFRDKASRYTFVFYTASRSDLQFHSFASDNFHFKVNSRSFMLFVAFVLIKNLLGAGCVIFHSFRRGAHFSKLAELELWRKNIRHAGVSCKGKQN